MNVTQWNNVLNAPLLILQLLQNYTMNDLNIKNHEVLHNIEYLKNAIAEINNNSVVKSPKCDSAINLIIRYDKDGCLLHNAVAQRDYSAVDVLIEEGANLNGSCEGRTALYMAVENNDKIMIERLLNTSINTRAVNDKGDTPLQLAVKKGYDQAVELLAEKVPVAKDNEGNSLVHLAAASGHISTIKTLIKNNPYILKSRNDRQETPLFVAAAHGHEDAFKALKELGANIRTYDYQYNRVLHKAVIGGNNHIVENILRHSKSDLSATNKQQNTPLHLALKAGQRNIVKTLLDAGSNLHMKGEYGNSVLHFAAEGDLSDYVNRFINNYHFAVDIQNNQHSTPLHKAASTNHYRAAKALLDNNADPNAVNNLQRTPLHSAAMNNATGIIGLLCSHSADKDARDYSGKTPSELAADSKFFESAYEVEHTCHTL